MLQANFILTVSKKMDANMSPLVSMV